MMIENKPGVVRPMRKALKELGMASCPVIARQLARNADLAMRLILWNVEGGVDPGGLREAMFKLGTATALLLNTPQRKVASEMM